MYYPRALPKRGRLSGLDFEYLERGEGPPLLYLHAGEGLDPDAPVLERLARRFRVTALAHPGFGLSESSPQFRTVDDLAYFYLDYLDAHDLKDLTVVGSSIGAWIALEVATKDCSRIRSLVLDNPVGLRFGDRKARDFQLDLFQIMPTDWSKLFLAGEPADERNWEAEPEDVALRASRNRESFTRFAWAPYLHNPQLNGRLHRVRAPALVLWGDQDRLASRKYAESVAKALPNGMLRVVAGAGHYAFHDQPAAVAEAVLAFARQPETAS
jgi:pimeloyl-ACP methyl ester carboxylesterase